MQVELTRQFSVERLAGALREWAAAAANVPPFSLMVPTGKGQPPQLIEPRALFPAEVIEATKWIWIRGGAERQPAAGVPLSAVGQFVPRLKAPASETAAHTIIGDLLQKSIPLLLFTGDQLTRSGKTVQKLNVPSRYSAVDAFALLGVALYKLNRKKETYMSQSAFQLGRMLSLADTLHAQYCQAVRGGDLPPQLLGNQHHSMATENPPASLGRPRRPPADLPGLGSDRACQRRDAVSSMFGVVTEPEDRERSQSARARTGIIRLTAAPTTE